MLKLMDLQGPGIESIQSVGESISGTTLLCLEGPEDSVPYDQSPAVVFVDAVPVLSMVDTVVARSVQDVFQGAKRLYAFGVNQKLVQAVELPMYQICTRRQDEC